MEEYFIILLIPIFWWALSIGYQLTKLIKLWISDKLLTLKELRIWD